jgi:hypothetical protein
MNEQRTPWPESATELYRPSDHRLSTKLVPTSCRWRVSRGERDGSLRHILGFLDHSRYFFFQVAPQLYSRGWADPIPDPLLLRKSDSAENRTRAPGSGQRDGSLRRILGFLDQSRYVFFQVVPQLYSRGWADPILRKSGSAENRTRTSGSVARNSNH